MDTAADAPAGVGAAPIHTPAAIALGRIRRSYAYGMQDWVFGHDWRRMHSVNARYNAWKYVQTELALTIAGDATWGHIEPAVVALFEKVSAHMQAFSAVQS